jgi:hypothetical protein
VLLFTSSDVIGTDSFYDYFSLPRFVCPKEARQVINQFGITEVKECKVFDSRLNDENAKLVYLVNGPGMDCIAGCFYFPSYTIVQEGKIYEMPAEPDLFNTLKNNFGDWCAFENRNINWANLKKFAVQNRSELFWAYDFNNFSTEIYWKDRLKNDEFEATIENPNNCILNGILITKNNNQIKTEVDISKMSYKLENMNDYLPKSLNEGLEKCLSTRWSKLECYELYAMARKEPQLCFGDYEKYLTDFHKKLYGSHNNCLDRVLDSTRDVAVCEKLADKNQHELCEVSFKELMNKLHGFYPSTYPNSY